jgi:hypothetical protein
MDLGAVTAANYHQSTSVPHVLAMLAKDRWLLLVMEEPESAIKTVSPVLPMRPYIDEIDGFSFLLFFRLQSQKRARKTIDDEYYVFIGTVAAINPRWPVRTLVACGSSNC